MARIKIENKKIDGSLIEDVGNIIKLTNLSPSLFGFTINLKNGNIINYFREFNQENESNIFLEIEKKYLQIKNEIEKR